MNTQELVATLNPLQLAALYAFRDELRAMYSIAEKDLKTLHDKAVVEKESVSVECDGLTAQVEMLTKERDEALKQVESLTAEGLSLSLKLAESEEKQKAIEAAYNAKAQELADVYELLGEKPEIAKIKKQRAIEALDEQTAALAAQKAELMAEPDEAVEDEA